MEARRIAGRGARTAWRVGVGVLGGTLLAVGIAMLVLPGPALLVIPAGLAVLALEFEAPRRWRDRLLEALRRRRRARSTR